MRSCRSGYSSIDVLMVSAVLAVAGAASVSSLRTARQRSNETVAQAFLVSLAEAQHEFVAKGCVDVDRDGVCEYGWFGELSGATALRMPTEYGAKSIVLSDPALGENAGRIRPDVHGEGILYRSGYYFKLFLPGKDGVPVGEASAGGDSGSLRPVDSDLAEKFWVCYAWPKEWGVTGSAAFMMNQDGEIMRASNNGALPYSGDGRAENDHVPSGDASVILSEAGSMTGVHSIGDRPEKAFDGNRWVATPQD